ncbi:MAG: alpha/beta hydrolase [Deltaproteobacteria bacterium]|nr:alpha/beta hydrolase [Deltaproteobacteria bacterium]
MLLSFSNWIGGISFAQTMAQSRAEHKPTILYDIPYTKAADVKIARRQTLDLTLPPRTKSKPPLVVFIHGGFWTLSDDDYRIGPAWADVLSVRNIAVALVRFRLAPKHRHPAEARDVAAAVAYLIRKADQYGYDAKRIYLAGHSSGAHLAALITLDPRYLAKHRMSSKSLAGVIAISGLYDLSHQMRSSEEAKIAIVHAFGTDGKAIKAASPLTHVRADTPPFLILAGSSDFDGFRVDARKFAAALRAAGHREVEQYVVPDRDHFSMVELSGEFSETRSLLLAFLNVEPLSEELQDLLASKRRWLNPPFSTALFWRHEKLIRPFPIDRRFVEKLLPIYGPMKYELREWPLDRYYAIDLFSYLDSLPEKKIGKGRFLVITNLHDEKQFWDRKQVEPYKPVIVIGIDEEKNLFRFGVFYRALREYSWKPGPRPPMMARPLGAFIHFLKEPPVELQVQSSHYALTPESFRLFNDDPLKRLRNIPKEVYEVLTYRNGCVYCHSFRGVGSRSHHTLVSTGAPHGGFALPLETYPPKVWKDFIFSQHQVADKIGASPNVVEENVRQELYDLVVKDRRRLRKPKK